MVCYGWCYVAFSCSMCLTLVICLPVLYYMIKMTSLEHEKKVLRLTHRKLSSRAPDGIEIALDRMSWGDLSELGVSDAYDYFISFIKELFDIYAPVEKVEIPRKYERPINDSWITCGILKSSSTQQTKIETSTRS